MDSAADTENSAAALTQTLWQVRQLAPRAAAAPLDVDVCNGTQGMQTTLVLSRRHSVLAHNPYTSKARGSAAQQLRHAPTCVEDTTPASNSGN